MLRVPRTAKIAESKQLKKKSEISLNSSMFNIYEKIAKFKIFPKCTNMCHKCSFGCSFRKFVLKL